MKIFVADYPTPRHSAFELRGAPRDLLFEHPDCQSLQGILERIDVRIMYKAGTRSPLGDFPEIDEHGLAVSERALAIFREEIDTFFEVIPMHVTHGGEIKRSSVWNKTVLSELPDIPDKNDSFFYLHPVRALQRGQDGPAPLPVYEPGDFTGVEIDEADLRKRIEEAKKSYKGWLGELQADIGSFPVGPLFVAGRTSRDARTPVQICFTEEFQRICKREKLTRIKLCEVRNGLSPWTHLAE